MTDDEALQNRFETVAVYVRDGHLGMLTTDQKLDLYGLFSVATKGPAEPKGPSALLDPVGFQKWTAWSAVSHLTSEEATTAYIDLVADLRNRKTGKPARGGDSSTGGFGTKGSTGFILGDDGDESKNSNNNNNSNRNNDENPKQDICHYVSLGSLNLVRDELLRDRDLANFRDDEDLTPLMRAADRDDAKMVALLLSVGAAPNAADADGQTALHYAVLCEHVDMVGRLVVGGADVNIRDNDGVTPFDMAEGEIRDVMQNALAGRFQPKNVGEDRLEVPTMSTVSKVCTEIVQYPGVVVLLGLAGAFMLWRAIRR